MTYGNPPHYRNIATGRIEPLPWRVRMPNGLTRTDPIQYRDDPEVLSAAGFVLTEITAEDEILPVPPPPTTVSARQVRLWLVANGISLEAVTAAIDAIPDDTQRQTLKIEWEYAPYIERTHPMLDVIAATLGLQPEQIDAAFIAASNL